MKLKQTPEDFIVDEVFDLEKIKEKEEEKYNYIYLKLTKKNYSGSKAIDRVARVFRLQRKRIHFSGTKDRTGITTQIISLQNPNLKTLENNISYFNDKVKDLYLEYLSEGKCRVSLGDHVANRFSITVRDLNKGLDKEKICEIIEEKENKGVLNYFDSQRFGFANNSHLIGLEVLRNQIEEAVKIILLSFPENMRDDERYVTYNNLIRSNWEEIKEGNVEIIDSIVKLAPKFLSDEQVILNHLKIFKNDFSGALRTMPKKIRTLYLNAYQSHIFNSCIEKFPNEEEIQLTNWNFEEGEIKNFIESFLKKDGISFDSFKLEHMPELYVEDIVKRSVKTFPKNLELLNFEEDDLNEGKDKVTIRFELDKGSYATNVVKEIFKDQSQQSNP